MSDRLADRWSLEQIAGFLKVWHAGRSDLHVNHETIYKTLFMQSRPALSHKLTKQLRTRRPIRKHKKNTVRGQLRSVIAGAVSIHDRPAGADERAQDGHWEGDLVFGRGLTQIATVVDRATRYSVLVQLDGRDMATVTDRLCDEMNQFPNALRRTLTWDRDMDSPATARSPHAVDSTSTSPTRAAPGNAEPTRTPTASHASISRRIRR